MNSFIKNETIYTRHPEYKKASLSFNINDMIFSDASFVIYLPRLAKVRSFNLLYLTEIIEEYRVGLLMGYSRSLV
jgi:hypothetical protein